MDDALNDQEVYTTSWTENLAKLARIPARVDFIGLIRPTDLTPRKGAKAASQIQTTLRDFADPEEVQKAVATSKEEMNKLNDYIKELSNMGEKVVFDHDELIGALSHSQSRSVVDDREEPMRLLDEVEILTKKVASDYEHVMSLPAGTKSIAQVSKLALLHTRNYLPSLSEYALEMSDLLQRSAAQRNNAMQLAIQHMQTIASIESTLSRLTSELDALAIPSGAAGALSTLEFAARLPDIYGSLLIESVRRHEWVEKMKRDSSALAEELAGYQEEEERRRKKWLKSMGDTFNIDTLEGKALGVEINLQAEEQSWPSVGRNDLQDYSKTLRELEGLAQEADTFEEAVAGLDKPTRQQIKRTKTFKMGSLHEAAFGNASLRLRGEDETRTLRDANSRLEEELKGQRSRVRKLEDLLHRQSHVGRVSTGSGFQPQVGSNQEIAVLDQQNPPSPRPPGELSRRSSVSSRRFSSNQGAEEKALARRVLKLEAELMSEKEVRAGLEKESLAKSVAGNDIQRQIEEANSTKKDLMENMEAQQNEFANERRVLEEETNKYKFKVEDLEEELDRILGSRDNERTGIDNRMRTLESELVKVRKDAADRVQKADNHIKKLEAAVKDGETSRAEHYLVLATIFSHLGSNNEVPEDHEKLLEDLERLAERSKDHVQELTNAIAVVRAENEQLQTTAEAQKTEIAELTSTFNARTSELTKVRQQFAAEKARTRSISAELEEEHAHLEILRSKFAEGETGSEALRQRVAEEEARVARLSSDLAATKSHVNSLDVELSSLQSTHDKLQSYTDASDLRLQQRSQRAKALTQKLHAQSDRLIRLLETLGFVVSRQDDSMVVQRASKAGASTVLSDQSTGMNRSLSSPLPSKRPLDESADLSSLFWMDKEKPEEEAAKYAEYLSAIERFDLGTFSEAITKRMRDVEHTARKWQREARAYRDKSYRAFDEAREKIAYRGFKEGDLALFLPTRNQATKPWAAFNIGAPHYFLREQDSHRLINKEYLVARISKIEERVVDLSKSLDPTRGATDRRSLVSDGTISFEDDNPFELSDGLRWYLLDAAEEKAGAPSTPGLGKSTVASAHIDARGSIRVKKSGSGNDASKTLNKSLDSRRSSSNSKKGVVTLRPGSSDTLGGPDASKAGGVGPSRLSNESRNPPPIAPSSPGLGLDSPDDLGTSDQVRRDLLWGP